MSSLKLRPYANIPPEKVALIIIDVWDNHWCSTAASRTDRLAQKINPLLQRMRDNGVQIIHAPSECQKYYQKRIANRGSHDLEKILLDPRKWDGCLNDVDNFSCDGTAPAYIENLLPSLKDSCDGTGSSHKCWQQENAHIIIDDKQDIIIFENKRQRLIHFLYRRGIEHLVYAGVATNMCVLYTRNISLKNLLNVSGAVARHGQDFKIFKLRCYLARDLTDAALPDRLLKDFRPSTFGRIPRLPR
jgi:nicotinamidase-related amidase